MELKEVIQQMIQQTQKATQPTEMQVGTVASVNPLEIKLDTNMATLNESVLYLTEPWSKRKSPSCSTRTATTAARRPRHFWRARLYAERTAPTSP